MEGEGSRFRATLFEIAIGSHNGTATFHMSGLKTEQPGRTDWFDSGSLRKPKRHLEVYPWVSFDRTLEVTVQTLDSWTASQNMDRIDFIWADIQGAEVDLIKGATESLKRTRYLYTEYNDQELYEGQVGLDEIGRMLPDFRLRKRYSEDVLLENKAFEENRCSICMR